MALSHSLIVAAFALACLCVTTSSHAQSVEQVVPQVKASGYVTDLGGVLSQQGKDQINALCTEVAQKTQSEIAVVTIKTLDGRPIEDYVDRKSVV